MKRKSRTSCWRSRRGVTLVEAVLGTALLASLLVSILLAASRLQIQATRAERRITACRIADRLLKTWWAKRDEFPRARSGRVASPEGWSWRTEVVADESARTLRCDVVALEIFAPDSKDGDPAARVELMVPEKEDADETGPDAR